MFLVSVIHAISFFAVSVSNGIPWNDSQKNLLSSFALFTGRDFIRELNWAHINLSPDYYIIVTSVNSTEKSPQKSAFFSSLLLFIRRFDFIIFASRFDLHWQKSIRFSLHENYSLTFFEVFFLFFSFFLVWLLIVFQLFIVSCYQATGSTHNSRNLRCNTHNTIIDCFDFEVDEWWIGHFLFYEWRKKNVLTSSKFQEKKQQFFCCFNFISFI